jgi:hypothetical protein
LGEELISDLSRRRPNINNLSANGVLEAANPLIGQNGITLESLQTMVNDLMDAINSAGDIG